MASTLLTFGFMRPTTQEGMKAADAAREAREAADHATAAREKNERVAAASARAQAGLPPSRQLSMTRAAVKKREQRAAKKKTTSRQPDTDAADPDKSKHKKVRHRHRLPHRCNLPPNFFLSHFSPN